MFVLDYLVPRHCAFCATSCRRPEKSICKGCFEDLPWKAEPASPNPGIFDQRIALLRYDFPVDVAIKALKFRRKLYYAPAFAEVLLEAERLLPDDIDAVMPVPLHWWREVRRGFNQATELAKPVAKHLGLPLWHGVRREKATAFQSGLRAAARTLNLRHAFAARGQCRYQHVLIVDDVTTTGATLIQLAKTLHEFGIGKVSALTVAEAQ